MAHVVLVVPTTTYRAGAFLAAATRLGVDVTTAAERTPGLADLLGDRFLRVPLDDPEAAAERIAELDARGHLDAVVAVDERGVLAAALASRRLGLPHNPPGAVAATRDKAAMRALLAVGGVAQPAFALCEGGPPEALLRRVEREADRLGFPVVVKPTGLSASRGVIRADDPRAARLAAERVVALLGRLGEPARLLVERYVPGDEVALEGLLVDGTLVPLALFDKPDPLVGPFFEETIYVTPSRHPASVQTAVATLVAGAARALGLVEGPVHAEARLAPSEHGATTPVLVELACRTIGGRCAAALRFADGTSLEELVLARALGREVSAVPAPGASGVMMLPIPASGRLVAVEGRDRALQVPGITGIDVTVPTGGHLEAFPEGDRYLGFLFAVGPDPAGVESALRAGFAQLEVRVDPTPEA